MHTKISSWISNWLLEHTICMTVFANENTRTEQALGGVLFFYSKTGRRAVLATQKVYRSKVEFILLYDAELPPKIWKYIYFYFLGWLLALCHSLKGGGGERNGERGAHAVWKWTNKCEHLGSIKNSKLLGES